MFYIIYLAGVIFILMDGIGLDRFFSDYLDVYTLSFVLLPCVLIVFCTKSWKAFGQSFVFVFEKGEPTLPSYMESIRTVQMVMITAAVFGFIGFLTGMINGIRSLDFSSPDVYGWALRNTSAAMLSLFYPLLICVILLPVFFILRRQMTKRYADTGDSL